MVRRIKDDFIDTLVFRNKYEIAISDILILPVCFLKVKMKVNKKIKRNKARFHCLVAFRWIPNTKTWNTQFKIWNTQLSQKEVGKYPIASNPYLELCPIPPSKCNRFEHIGSDLNQFISANFGQKRGNPLKRGRFSSMYIGFTVFSFTLCMLGNLTCFCCLLIFLKNKLLAKLAS